MLVVDPSRPPRRFLNGILTRPDRILTGGFRHDVGVITIYGACALTFMMVMYALEHRAKGFVLAFAVGCALSSSYGFLSGAWPFGVVELIWAGIAVRRWRAAA